MPKQRYTPEENIYEVEEIIILTFVWLRCWFEVGMFRFSIAVWSARLVHLVRLV